MSKLNDIDGNKPSAAEIIAEGQRLFGHTPEGKKFFNRLAVGYDLETASKGIEPESRPSESARTPKRAKAKGIIYGDPTTIEAPGKSIPARYALIELSSLITSHNPTSFAPDKRYPEGCQQRDYSHDKAEQRKVEQNAAKFNPRYLVTDSPTATDGPPVVTAAGIVLGGNSRTMSLKLAGDFDKYRDYLKKAVSVYGLTAGDLDELKQPTLVRVVEIEMSQCAFFSNLLNKNLTQGVDVTTETVSYARQLSASDLESLATVFEESGEETWAKVIALRNVQAAILRRFRSSGIITDQNASEWATNGGELTDKGKLLTEKVLIGALLPNKDLIEAARTYTGHLLRNLPLMIRVQRLPGEWNLMPAIQDVIKLESERRSAGTDKAKFLNQTSFDRAEITERQRMVWELLDMSPKPFRAALEYYLRLADGAVNTERQGSGFDFDSAPAKEVTPDDALRKVLGKAGVSLSDGPVKKRRVKQDDDSGEMIAWGIGVGLLILAFTSNRR